VKCNQCSVIVRRGQYQSHWNNECAIKCYYTSSGCTTGVTRSTQLSHEASCEHAPRLCPAHIMGCTYRGSPSTMNIHVATCQRAQSELTLQGHASSLRDLDRKLVVLTREATAAHSSHDDITNEIASLATTTGIASSIADERIANGIKLASRTATMQHQLNQLMARYNASLTSPIMVPHRRTIVTGNPMST
jgi:hypothetical protein